MDLPGTEPCVSLDAIAVSFEQANALTSLGRTTLHRLVADGALESVKVGRRRLILVRSLRALLERSVAA